MQRFAQSAGLPAIHPNMDARRSSTIINHAWNCRDSLQLLDCEILVAGPTVDNGEILNQQWAVDSIFFYRNKLNSSLAMFDRLIVVTESSFDHSESASAPAKLGCSRTIFSPSARAAKKKSREQRYPHARAKNPSHQPRGKRTVPILQARICCDSLARPPPNHAHTVRRKTDSGNLRCNGGIFRRRPAESWRASISCQRATPSQRPHGRPRVPTSSGTICNRAIEGRGHLGKLAHVFVGNGQVVKQIDISWIQLQRLG